VSDREQGDHEAMRTHGEMRDDLAAYAIGALPRDEAAELEGHLAGCESCRARLRWLQPAVDMLPASVEQLTPPERIRNELMATVRAEAEAEARTESPPARAGPRPRWRDWGGFLLRPATAVGAVVLVVAGTAAGYALRGSSEDETTVIEARASSPAQADLVSATLERSDGSATLHVRELPPIDPGEVYEVWVQRAGAVEPSNTFVLNDDGTAVAAVPGSLEDADAVLVTREPLGGSERPTSPPVLEAPLN
jgi:anti-sigma-K factor RskA